MEQVFLYHLLCCGLILTAYHGGNVETSLHSLPHNQRSCFPVCTHNCDFHTKDTSIVFLFLFAVCCFRLQDYNISIGIKSEVSTLMCRSHQKETIAENTAFLQVKWQDGMVETRFRLLGDHGQVLLIRNELGRMKNDLWEACLPGKRITGMRYHLIPVIFFLTSAPNHAGAAFESRHHRAGRGDGGGGRCRRGRRSECCFSNGAGGFR